MAEQVSSALPSLGFFLEYSTVLAMSTPVKVAGLKSLTWSGFECDSVDVTESESYMWDGTTSPLIYRSKPGRPKPGTWSCKGNLILSAAIVGDGNELHIAQLKARTVGYWRVTFITGGTILASGFVKNFEPEFGEGGAMSVSFTIELDGGYLLATYA